jgi:YidC/Oxa1 family membrane protein insertase
MLPLRLPTMRSQLKMQKIQPQLAEIKERYKKYKLGDPKKQDEQMEVMALHKREGINMFAGCIPMLLQLPFLYAFYAVLGNTIELRQAHWAWIGDLSSPDPYHVLPILFVTTMFLTQKLMPSPGVDPAQQRMMSIMMPVMLGVFTWNYASGLSLYWAASNLLQIGQQFAMNQTKLGKETRALLAKRAARKKEKER